MLKKFRTRIRYYNIPKALAGNPTPQGALSLIGTGIAVDKMLALTRQLPSVQIANVILPTPEEDARRRAIDAKLDEITRWLNDGAQTREHAR